MDPIIEFDHVSKQFRLRDGSRSFQELFLNALRMRRSPPAETLWSLRDVSFSVQPGEMVGIIGANGAGKSTALKLVSRIIVPTQGQVKIRGKVTGLLELGAGFHPDLSGRENIYLNGAMLGMKREQIDRRLDAIVAFAELEQFINMPVKHYSSGMYMRLGFAIAVHSDTDALLVDEVLAVGDQAFRSKCFERITDIRRKGTAILLVSHDAGVVRRMCDRALWLDKGRVRSMGTADDVIMDYMSQVWQERDRQLAE
ncbi:MAG: ABC transporter ATP-binding protein, partial [Anaerolineae bacterium]